MPNRPRCPVCDGARRGGIRVCADLPYTLVVEREWFRPIIRDANL
ncbi:hypothetical protein MBEHAL_0587 [Halarchaeum acidiphilum MH1-52-1]|uniref:Uncharacterized protein n=1 Tax=Halarchaeum acidiphilum MH1-52-1 TaxID=1261545 RepID=U2YSY1_9EURY|nr:hypothetical protein MBEHAL_0587 [Halarchaeum acidiphilum MH1-52-1]